MLIFQTLKGILPSAYYVDHHNYLFRYMEKRLLLQLNANRRITGVLRGYDPFMNLVLDEAVEEKSTDNRIPLGLAVMHNL